MKKFRYLIWVFTVLLALGSVKLADAGGWAVVTVHHVPGGVKPGEPFEISFSVRQHGIHLSGGLESSVNVKHMESGEEINFEARNGKREGDYIATLLLPEAGDWRWSILTFEQEFPQPVLQVQPVDAVQPPSRSLQVLPGILLALGFAGLALGGIFLARKHRFLALGSSIAAVLLIGFAAAFVDRTPPAIAASEERTLAQRGTDLFISKGCVTCHRNDNIEVTYSRFSTGVGPDLTHYQGNATFLQAWLADPQSQRPETYMPNLELSGEDIEALVAFLLREGEQVRLP